MADRIEMTMAEEQQPAAAPVEEEEIDWYGNALRNPSLEAIQQALSKALSELTGKKYRIHVMRMDFAPKWAGGSAAMSDSTEILLRVSPAPRPRWQPSDDDDKGSAR